MSSDEIKVGDVMVLRGLPGGDREVVVRLVYPLDVDRPKRGRPIDPGSARQVRPWDELGISERTWRRWKKAGKING